MNAVSINHLWSYLQSLSLTASNRKWLAEKLVAPIEEQTATPPVLQTWEEALSDLDESEKEFERGDVLSAKNSIFNAEHSLTDDLLCEGRCTSCSSLLGHADASRQPSQENINVSYPRIFVFSGANITLFS